jgi:hypothetical protein
MVHKLSPSQERIFNALFSFSVISLIAFAVLFFILCSKENLSSSDTEPADRNVSTHPVLGQFDSTGAAIIIIGMPLLFILLNYLYLYAYRM